MDFAAEGWTRLPTRAFSAVIGAAWVKGGPGQRTVGLVAGEDIVNDYGQVVHGGALLTFADMVLGMGASDALNGGPLVTAQLQYQFVGGVKVGNLVTGEPELVRKTTSLVFVRALIRADGAVVGSTEGIFKPLTVKG